MARSNPFQQTSPLREKDLSRQDAHGKNVFGSDQVGLPGMKVHRWITIQKDGEEYLISPVSGNAVKLSGATLRSEERRVGKECRL